MSHKNKIEKKPKQSNEDLHVIEDDGGIEIDVGSSFEKKTGIKQRSMDHGELKELIEKNIKWSQVIYNQNKKINRRLTVMVIGNYIRLILILAPIILGIIFLPSLLEQYMPQLTSLFGGATGTSLYDLGSLLQGSNSDSTQIQELIQNIR